MYVPVRSLQLAKPHIPLGQLYRSQKRKQGLSPSLPVKPSANKRLHLWYGDASSSIPGRVQLSGSTAIRIILSEG
jgi:hypothetical protein